MTFRAVLALAALLPALPAAAAITIDEPATQASIQSVVQDFRVTGLEDVDRAALDPVDGQASATAQLGGEGASLRATTAVQSRVTIDETSARVEITGSYRIVHAFDDPLVLENIGSRAQANVRVGLCTDEPVTFQYSASGAIQSTRTTFRTRGGERPSFYATGFVSSTFSDFFQQLGTLAAGLGVTDIDDQLLPPTDTASTDGRVEAGCYTLDLLLDADLRAPFHDAVVGPVLYVPLAQGDFRVALELGPTAPDEGDVFTWVGPSQGAFSSSANWEDEGGAAGIPDFTSFADADTAVVLGSGDVTLDLATAALARAPRGALPERRTGRLEAALSGTLRPVGGTLILDSLAPELAARSLEIEGGATIRLDAGGIQARHVTLGALGDGTLEVVGPDGFFAASGRFGIGGADDGRVEISNGAAVTSAETVIGEDAGGGFARASDLGTLWQTGNAAIGFADDALLVVENGARVESEKAFVDCRTASCIGLADLERAAVAVRGRAADRTPSTWALTEELAIGPLGAVRIEGGGALALPAGVLSIGLGIGTPNCVTGSACFDVTDGRADVGSIRVGLAGPGRMQIGPAGRVVVAGIGETSVGSDPGQRGDLLVAGPSAEPQLVSSLSVGTTAGSHGEVVLSSGANVTSSLVGIGGAGPGADGIVELGEGSLLRVTSALEVGGESGGAPFDRPSGELVLFSSRVELENATLHVRRTGSVAGGGSIDGFGVSFVSNDGEMGCGVTINAAYVQLPNGIVGCPQAVPQPVTTTSPLLSPLAASRFARAVRAKPKPVPPPPGPFTVNGDATLDGTLVLQFLNGFAPRQGDAFELARISGTVTGAFATVAARGLAPGADFEQTLADGTLTLTALTDAEPLPAVSIKAKRATAEDKIKGSQLKLVRNGDTSQPLAVALRIGGTATNGFDYEAIASVVEIPARKKSAKIPLRPHPDGLVEGTETITLEVVPGEGYAPSLAAKATIELADEKPPKKPRKPRPGGGGGGAS